jgi:hypothetical protein
MDIPSYERTASAANRLSTSKPENSDSICECSVEQYLEPNRARRIDTFLSQHRQVITPMLGRYPTG